MKSLVACYWWYTCTWHMMSHMSHWWCVIVIITHVICLGNVTPRPMSLVSSQIRSGTRMNVVMIPVILSVQGTVSEWLIVLMTSPTANCRWQEVNITTGEREWDSALRLHRDQLQNQLSKSDWWKLQTTWATAVTEKDHDFYFHCCF